MVGTGRFCSCLGCFGQKKARVAAGFDLVFGWCLVALSGDCYAGSFLFAAHPWGYERAAVRAYRTRFRASILGRTVFCEKKEPARKDTNIGYDREIYVFSWEFGCGGTQPSQLAFPIDLPTRAGTDGGR